MGKATSFPYNFIKYRPATSVNIFYGTTVKDANKEVDEVRGAAPAHDRGPTHLGLREARQLIRRLGIRCRFCWGVAWRGD